MLIGRAGFGKSEMVAQWARKNNIHLYEIDLSTASPELFGGVVARDPDDPGYSTTLPSKELLNELSVPNTVLFLDEYNRAKDSIRAPLHTLVLDRKIRDPKTPGGWRDMSDTLLFAVAALNPSSSSYRGAKPLEPSEVSRYRILQREGDPLKHLNYLTTLYTSVIKDEDADEDEKQEAQGKLALATKILKDPDFSYTTAEEEEEHEEEI
jgi:MoxR-like ATPase